jgi:hypothetical protein
METRHLGVLVGLVEENKAVRINEGLGCSPQRTPRSYVGPVLLGCARGFFFDGPRR